MRGETRRSVGDGSVATDDQNIDCGSCRLQLQPEQLADRSRNVVAASRVDASRGSQAPSIWSKVFAIRLPVGVKKLRTFRSARAFH